MTNETLQAMAAFFAREVHQGTSVLDVGSFNINGSFREPCEAAGGLYVGLDIVPGRGVDIVVEDPYWWPVEDSSFDVVVSGNTFEHIRQPWQTILEMKRALKRGGKMCIIAPSQGPRHDHPVDCWRMFPEALESLAEWAELKVIGLGTLDHEALWKSSIMEAQKVW